MTDHRYLLDNAEAVAGVRLRVLAEVFDPVTFAHLERLGLASGWRCWEVGAGGPSVPVGLAERVAPGGSVLATDLDVTWLEGLGPDVEVRRHDLAADPPPIGPFDLVHARLVLVHVAARQEALATMVGALAPGGWLVLEDADPALQPLSVLDPSDEEGALANRLRQGFRSLLADRGADLAFGRRLPGLLRSAGLEQVGADAWFPVADPRCALLEEATIASIGPQLVAAGLATDDELGRHLEAVQSGRLDLVQPPLVSAWGRRPA